MGPSDLKDYFLKNILNKTGLGKPNQKYLGVEYEKFVLISSPSEKKSQYLPLSMSGKASVQQLLHNFAEASLKDGLEWEKVYEKKALLALNDQTGQNVTVEPGGQIELSDAPRQTLQEVDEAIKAHLRYMELAIQPFQGEMVFTGVHPVFPIREIPLLEKKRYHIMFPYMQEVGSLGQTMMKATAGTQVSLDYFSIEDLERKFVTLNRMVPFIAAIFANSPLLEGKPSGYKSYRSHIWMHTDPYRAGLPEAFLKSSFKLEDYIDWALKVSPYLLNRGGEYVNLTKFSFQELIEGKQKEIKITLEDWEQHLRMLFPEMRIKKIIELRSMDTLNPSDIMAVPAFFKALIYNDHALEQVQSILMDLRVEDFPDYQKAAAQEGLAVELHGVNFSKMAWQFFEIALTSLGSKEEHWLLPYFEKYTKHKKTPADVILEDYKKAGSDVFKWLPMELKRAKEGMPKV